MSPSTPFRIAILISGRGSNMQSIVSACNKGQIPGEVCCVLSNVETAAGLKYAKANNIATEALSHRGFPDRESFDKQLVAILDKYQPNLIVLAGFMRILTPVFIDHYSQRIINIHPSLLPKYTGLNTHDRVLQSSDRQHGASVHYVINDLDAGPVIVQATIDILEDDTADKLATRVLASEHIIYPMAVEWIAKGLVSMDGSHCVYRNSAMVKPANWYNGTLNEPEVL